MNYDEFLKMMAAGEVLTKEIMERHRMTDDEREKEEDEKKRKMYKDSGLDAVVDRFRMERRKRNLLPQTMFDLFDVDNNGSLSNEELEDALVRMKMPHTGLEVEGMVFMFDHDKDGLLDYSEFLELVTGGTSKQANQYRMVKKMHPAHEPAHDSDSDEDEHSSYLIAPPGTQSYRSSGKKRKKQKGKGKDRANSISMITSTVSLVPAESRRLVVTIHQATGLPPMDVMGSADPFVLLTCGRKSVKTRVSKATLSPKWDQEFRFGDDRRIQGRRGLGGRRGRGGTGGSDTSKITLVVKDWNRIGPAQFIGQVDVDLFMMEGQPVGIPVRMSYPLEALSKKSDGHLLVKSDRRYDALGEVSRGMIDISLSIEDGRGEEEDSGDSEENSEEDSEEEEEETSDDEEE
jgi:Ca2+-binding EF-hand superfamily protein